jgi:hypothetical protein
MKWLPQFHVVKSRSPAYGVILGDSGNFRKWGLEEGSRSLGDTFGYLVSVHLSLLPFCSEVKKLH